MIDRVSTLFRGHPSLIQGFNTFLPPGYRIECFMGDGDSQGLITVTTPTGTISQMPGGLAAAMKENDREARESAAAAAVAANAAAAVAARQNGRTVTPPKREATTPAPLSGPSSNPPSSFHTTVTGLASGPPPLQSSGNHTSRATPAAASGYALATGSGYTANLPASATVKPVTTSRPVPPRATTPVAQSAAPGPLPIPPSAQIPLPASGPSTPSAAQFLASGGLGGAQALQTASQPAQNRTGAPMVEFNHAIAFVNKIKNRFNSDPDTYKQFLEILQTYQRDTRDIAEASPVVCVFASLISL